MIALSNPILDVIEKTLSETSDVQYKSIPISRGTLTIVFINNIVEKRLLSFHLLEPLLHTLKSLDSMEAIQDVICTPVTEILNTPEEAIEKLLSGYAVITTDFDPRALCCDVSDYSSRNVQKPDTDPVIKGPQEGFTESIENNLSLIRKRIRNKDLIIKMFTLGTSSQTPVAVIYLQGAAPEKLVEHVLNKVSQLKTNVVLETNYIEEEFKERITLFDTVGNYEKPDVICANLFEGRVAIMVEGSPSVAVLPYFFMENFQSPDDYYTNRYVVAAMRIFRYFSFVVSILLPAFYVALTTYHHSLVPMVFLFKLASARAGVPFPSIAEILLMILFLELSREAGRRLPKSIGTTLSLVSTLILGETALKAGLASGGTIVIVGIYAVTTLINPKLVGPTIILSVINVILSSIFGLHGFYLFFIMMIAHLASLDSCGYPYLYPMGTIGQNSSNSKDLLVRGKLKEISYNTLGGKKKP